MSRIAASDAEDEGSVEEIANKIADLELAIDETLKVIGARAIAEGDKPRVARELHWDHGTDVSKLARLCSTNPDQILEWVQWKQIEYQCKCGRAVGIWFPTFDAYVGSNLARVLCSACQRLILREQWRVEGEERRQKLVGHLRSLPYDDYLKTDHWQGVRLQALERDHRRCRVCNSPDNLNVHHRTYERRGEELPDDVTTLCQSCHEMFHANGKLGRPE